MVLYRFTILKEHKLPQIQPTTYITSVPISSALTYYECYVLFPEDAYAQGSLLHAFNIYKSFFNLVFMRFLNLPAGCHGPMCIAIWFPL